MKNPEELENKFKDAFDAFEEQPSGAVWDRISEDREVKQRIGITDFTPESVFSATFRNFSSGPAEAVWIGVRSYLMRKWWMRNLKWSALLLLIGVGTAVFIYNSDENETIEPISKSSRADSKTSSVEPFAVKSEKKTSISPKTVVPILESLNENVSVIKTLNLVRSKNIYMNSERPKPTSVNNPPEPLMNAIENIILQENAEPIVISRTNADEPQNLNDWEKNIVVGNANSILAMDRKANKARPDNLKKNSNIVKYTKETDINNEESPWKVGVMAGLDYSNYLLKGGNNLYREVRKSQELFNPGSFHVGLTFSRMMGSNWYIQSGFVYSNQTMLAAYNRKVVQADTVRDGSGNIVRIDQKVLFNVDTTASFRFTTLEIPLMVGYRIGDRRWTFHAMAGPSWNLVLVGSGAMLSPTTMRVEALSGMPLVKQQWGLWVAVGAGYQINHHIGLTVEPVFRYKFNSVFGSGYPAKQYNYATGINLGIRYHIK